MRAPLLRSLLAAGAGAAALAGAAASPALAASPRIDPETACDGGLYDIIIAHKFPTARCLNWDQSTRPGPGWWAPSVGDVVVDAAARKVSVRIDRVPGENNTWLGWSTQAGTATAGDDFTVAGSELFFTSTTSTALQQLWVDATWKDDGDTGEGPESFTIAFAKTVVDVNAPPPVTVTIPADASYVPPAPDPDPVSDPDPDPELPADPADEPAAGGEEVPAGEDETPAAPSAPGPRAAGEVSPPARAAAAAEAAPAPAAPAVAAPPVMARREQERTLDTTVAGRTRLPVACASACAITGRLTVSAAAARRLGLRSRTLGVGSVRGAGRVLVPLRVGSAARRALARSRRPVVVTVTVTGAGAPLTVRLTLKP